MSRRRFRPTDAFVDESIRGRRYLMGCVLAEARSLNDVRAEVAGLVTRGGRLHFHNEVANIILLGNIKNYGINSIVKIIVVEISDHTNNISLDAVVDEGLIQGFRPAHFFHKRFIHHY